MKRTGLILLFLLMTGKVDASEFPTNELGLTAVGLTNLIASINMGADLGAQFNWNTNENAVSDFDKQICDSLHIKSKAPIMITFKEVSVVFHFPDKEGLYSSSEMDGSLNLIYENGKISRTNTDEQSPADYIRLFDPAVKEPTAEVNLLLGVAPVAKPDDVKYVRRSFLFVHKKIWEMESQTSAAARFSGKLP